MLNLTNLLAEANQAVAVTAPEANAAATTATGTPTAVAGGGDLIMTIVMMRWGPWAGLHAALGGVVFCLTSGAGAKHYIIYAAGNLLSLAALAFIRAATAEGIRQSASKSLLLALAVTLLMQLGRALFAVIIGALPAMALGFFTTDAITLLFTLVLVWIARRLDGIFEDQNHYLLRIQRQEKEERGGF